MRRLAYALCAWSLTIVGCSDDETTGSTISPQTPVTYELDDALTSVLQEVWEPLVPSSATQAAIDGGDLLVTDIAAFEDAGLGVQLAEGLPWVEHDELAPGFAEGSDRKSIIYIWQAADPQLIDEESPIRFEGFDALYRPQGHLSTQVFEAHVRTAQRISDISGRPFDFAVIAGDLTDGSQKNELAWVTTALVGGVIDPDSGADDDPVPGGGNDYNDPFISDGISFPWYAAIGNHETLYNGGFGPITDELIAAATGDAVYEFPIFANGFRDGATAHADVVTEGTTVPDEDRAPQRLDEVLVHLHEAGGNPPGHGLSAEDVAEGRGYFSVHPIEGKPVRLITLDTVHSEAASVGIGSQGWIEVEQHQWLEEQLTDADLAGELVIVMSHHKAADLSDSSPVTAEQLSDTLDASDGLVVVITGHGHRNETALLTTTTGDGYWELMLASTVDFPMQSRVIEIVDEGNGFLSIYATNLDHNSPVDSLAHRGRELAAAKRAFGTVTQPGDIAAFWPADVPAQNLLLRVAISDALRDSLAAHEWPTRIESIETLQAL